MRLQSELRGTVGSPGDAVVVLLREWFDLDVESGVGFDRRGIHWLLSLLSEVAPQLPGGLREMFQPSGSIDSQGLVVVLKGQAPLVTRRGPPVGSVGTVDEHGDWDLVAEGLEQSVLNHLLNSMRLEAPIVGSGRFGDEVSAVARLSEFTPLGEWRNSRTDCVSFQFFASDKALVQFMPHRRDAMVFGLERAGVEAAWKGESGTWRWTRLDRIYGPDDDLRIGGSHRPFPGQQATRSGEDLRKILSIRDRTEATRRFLRSWYGRELPEVTGATGPPLLRALQRLNAESPVIGAHNILFQPSDEETDAEGRVWFFAENQHVWQAAYAEPINASAVAQGDRDPSAREPIRAIDLRLDEFLFRQVLSEAIVGAPCTAWRTGSDLEAAAEVLDRFNLAVGPPGARAGVWTDGRLLMHGGVGDGRAHLTVGAHERADIADSPLSGLGGWTWSYDEAERA